MNVCKDLDIPIKVAEVYWLAGGTPPGRSGARLQAVRGDLCRFETLNFMVGASSRVVVTNCLCISTRALYSAYWADLRILCMQVV